MKNNKREIDWQKKYNDLKVTYENEILRLNGLLRVANTERNDAKRETKSDSILDWIQCSPNPRLRLCTEAWRKGVDGVTLRSNFLHVMRTKPNAGFDVSDSEI